MNTLKKQEITREFICIAKEEISTAWLSHANKSRVSTIKRTLYRYGYDLYEDDVRKLCNVRHRDWPAVRAKISRFFRIDNMIWTHDGQMNKRANVLAKMEAKHPVRAEMVNNEKRAKVLQETVIVDKNFDCSNQLLKPKTLKPKPYSEAVNNSEWIADDGFIRNATERKGLSEAGARKLAAQVKAKMTGTSNSTTERSWLARKLASSLYIAILKAEKRQLFRCAFNKPQLKACQPSFNYDGDQERVRAMGFRNEPVNAAYAASDASPEAREKADFIRSMYQKNTTSNPLIRKG